MEFGEGARVKSACALHQMFEVPPGDQKACFLELASCQRMVLLRLNACTGWMVPVNGVVPAFHVQIRIISSPEKRMNNLGPVRFSQSRHAMLRHPRMTNAITAEQNAMDECVLGMHMKNTRTKLFNVPDRIDELADQMARVPFDPEVFMGGSIEEPFPHGRLSQHVAAHQGKMVRALGTMFEGNAHPMISSPPGQWTPKFQQRRKIILERFVNGVPATLAPLEFNHSARKAGHCPNAQKGSHFDGPLENLAGLIRLVRIERVGIEGPNGGYAEVKPGCCLTQFKGVGFPVRVARGARAVGEPDPLDGPEAEMAGPLQLVDFASG
jgi:hypothetical protein